MSYGPKNIIAAFVLYAGIIQRFPYNTGLFLLTSIRIVIIWKSHILYIYVYVYMRHSLYDFITHYRLPI